MRRCNSWAWLVGHTSSVAEGFPAGGPNCRHRVDSPQAAPQRAVLLDRDGIINVNRDDYVKSWAEFVFLPNAVAAIALLARLPVGIFVVTNQSVVGRGIITRAQLDAVHTRMTERIVSAGGRMDGIYVCPHAPWAGCTCRKPEPGLLLQAAAEHNLDLTRSFMVGDSTVDIHAARAAGCTAVLVGANESARRHADYVAGNLLEAMQWISAALRSDSGMGPEDPTA